MSKWIVIGLLVVMAGVTLFKRSEPWTGQDIEAAFESSKKDSKPIVAVVGAEWCGYCHELQNKTLPNGEVKKSLRDWRVTLVDQGTPSGDAFSRKYQVAVLPTILFLRPDGTEIDRAMGFLEPDEFVRAVPQKR